MRVGAKDADLVGRDLADGRAEHRRVVEVDVGEHGHVGVDDVGRVPRAAHAHFDDRDVDAFIGKMQQRRDGQAAQSA